jgi:hypothetical protein
LQFLVAEKIGGKGQRGSGFLHLLKAQQLKPIWQIRLSSMVFVYAKSNFLCPHLVAGELGHERLRVKLHAAIYPNNPIVFMSLRIKINSISLH